MYHCENLLLWKPGRAGREAPPLRGQKKFELLDPPQSRFLLRKFTIFIAIRSDESPLGAEHAAECACVGVSTSQGAAQE